MTTGLIAVLAALSLPPVSRDTVPLYTDLGTLEVPITTSAPLAQRYEKAMALLGVQPWMLAPGAGHA